MHMCHILIWTLAWGLWPQPVGWLLGWIGSSCSAFGQRLLCSCQVEMARCLHHSASASRPCAAHELWSLTLQAGRLPGHAAVLWPFAVQRAERVPGVAALLGPQQDGVRALLLHASSAPKVQHLCCACTEYPAACVLAIDSSPGALAHTAACWRPGCAWSHFCHLSS